MKHIFTPTSPLKNKASREQVHRVEVAVSLAKKIQRFGIFSFLLIVVIGLIGLGFVSLLTQKSDSTIIVFNYLDSNGNIDKNILAYYEQESGKTKLYHLDFSAKKTEESQPISNLTPTQASILFRVLINETMVLPAPEGEQTADDQTDTFKTHDYLKKSLWSSLTTASHTKLTKADFWRQAWWWWHLQNISSTQLAEKSFSDQEKWDSYELQRDIQVNAQPCSIAVVNTTPKPGLATDIGAILERSGLFVARLTTNRTDTQNSLILTKGDVECESVISLLKQLTPNSKEAVIDEAAATRYRASVVLLIGNDL